MRDPESRESKEGISMLGEDFMQIIERNCGWTVRCEEKKISLSLESTILLPSHGRK